jgi:hypothetical protein
MPWTDPVLGNVVVPQPGPASTYIFTQGRERGEVFVELRYSESPEIGATVYACRASGPTFGIALRKLADQWREAERP